MVQASTETTQQQYYLGIGKRKTAIARVKLYRNDEQGGQLSINGKSMEEYFPWFTWQEVVQQPFRVTGMERKFSMDAKIEGGGPASQSEALRHGISRALVAYDENLKKQLRQYGLLTRDSRIKESKKYGLKRARRAPQYTKR